ncbi:hypothetical protein EV141_0700 [Microcella putealis]|uniref:Uncharacterized protein n=1 Tax=Microcella putealis TaxID=337005 RepID=A0A4Q7LXE5_9MICO|nr:hypothetical protein [Microcella putealis]RZS59474.1 hypothetical protein EV141_0700 [Microcella putealis]TQM20099.1 hypothetical protein BJ957_2237 [Microcella putealis]
MISDTAAPYTILLPPGWVRMRVDESIQERFDALIDDVARRAPKDRQTPLRSLLGRTAQHAIDTARDRGALDVIVSLASVDDLPIPVSIATFSVPPPASDGRSPLEMLVGLANAGSRAIEIDGLAAIRRSVDVPATDDAPAYRTVSYVCHVPWLEEWLLFGASILTSDEPGFDEVLNALESLIDAMMSTVRFRREEGDA